MLNTKLKKMSEKVWFGTNYEKNCLNYYFPNTYFYRNKFNGYILLYKIIIFAGKKLL